MMHWQPTKLQGVLSVSVVPRGGGGWGGGEDLEGLFKGVQQLGPTLLCVLLHVHARVGGLLLGKLGVKVPHAQQELHGHHRLRTPLHCLHKHISRDKGGRAGEGEGGGTFPPSLLPLPFPSPHTTICFPGSANVCRVCSVLQRLITKGSFVHLDQTYKTPPPPFPFIPQIWNGNAYSK